MKISPLLRWLLAFLFPMVGPGEEDAGDLEGEGDDAGDLEGEGDDAGDDDGDDGKTGAVKPDPHEERVTAAEKLAREANEQVQALQRAAQNRPDPSADEEERKLRDPAVSDLEKWQIRSNRALLQSQLQSQQALFEAKDMADSTNYMAKSVSNPLYSKYKDKVEAELTKARSMGANPPREFLLERAIGRDMLAGNFKTKTTPVPAKQINRGKPNSARSDTPSRSGASDRDKRAARLQNINI